MVPKITIFAGAPDAKALNWDEAGLLTTFSAPFARFFHLNQLLSQDLDSAEPTALSGKHPVWRSIPLERQHLPTGISQDHAWRDEYQGNSFFTTSEIDSLTEDLSSKLGYESFRSSSESAEQVLSQFYEESYARHEDVPSSQIAALTDSEDSFTTSTSFETTKSIESPNSVIPKEVPITNNLNNISEIPNAAYLDSIQPQTMTVNLVVGIIVLPPPRLIKTRRGPDVELIEAIVGDETKSGFAVNFWLPSLSSVLPQAIEGDLRSAIRGLKTQDVVLIRNVALSSFRGKVYGQSLRKGMTKIHLLSRNRAGRKEKAGYYSAADLTSGNLVGTQVEKTRRVREWVLRFIGEEAPRRTGKRKAPHDDLPPDTQ